MDKKSASTIANVAQGIEVVLDEIRDYLIERIDSLEAPLGSSVNSSRQGIYDGILRYLVEEEAKLVEPMTPKEALWMGMVVTGVYGTLLAAFDEVRVEESSTDRPWSPSPDKAEVMVSTLSKEVIRQMAKFADLL